MTSANATTTTHGDAQGTGGPLRLAVIIGSTRTGRFAPVPAAWFADEVRKHHGFDVDVVDLAGLDVPDSLDGSADTDALGERLAAADAFVVVTPEYNHSYPAPLKAAIDYFHAEWLAKPVGFVTYGGMSGGLRAVEHLRGVFAELHAVTVRDTVSFYNYPDRFGDDGIPHDAESASQAAKGMLDQLSWWGRALHEARAVRPYGSN
ncbi:MULTISPECIES: NADPH-dependent FMN reductase [Prauserella salsuginis group]|uniref:NAD(P)H-dependent FMN reductase n=2 Tax=Prauserella salsuginis group TaxID=2893672 RepID=A0A839XGH5_9PSEU|nr:MULTISPECIES: NAD(P)H-dependent oxidoreductase [Prauserella salsuginis group]MBB3663062.1 NAD(P)H-dependent FMN reductase [Prauserella sediminis]MCR3721103.1 NAD(P)H-dependent FMN reductase [Prauserella flava]MCR3734816.1 NAD(P)H-dependent FMN reductase [Prauserella salsuginis]